MDEIVADFPDLYAPWIGHLLDGRPLPVESEATCARCPMVTTDPDKHGFHPAIKCCTFVPEVHNFLVGGILADRDSATDAGRATVLERIAQRRAVTPLGLGRSRAYSLVYDAGGAALFGRSPSLRCPHYLSSGRCGIWRHRESTCATWFCKHVRGSAGRDFWQALHRMLALVERELAWWSATEVGLDPVQLAQLTRVAFEQARAPRLGRADLEGEDPERYRSMWGRWADDEERFYVACAERVGQLAWPDVLAIAGAQARAAARVAQEAYAALSDSALPDCVAVAKFEVLGFGDGTVQLSGYSAHDSVELPAIVLEILPSFEGRTVADAIDELATRGVEIDREFLRRLLDLGILKPAVLPDASR